MEEDCSLAEIRPACSPVDETTSGTNSYLINRDLKQAIRALHEAYRSQITEVVEPRTTGDDPGRLIHLMGDLINKVIPLRPVNTAGCTGSSQAHRKPNHSFQPPSYRVRPRMVKENDRNLHRAERDTVSSFGLIRSRMSEWVNKLFPGSKRLQKSRFSDKKKSTWPNLINDQAAVKSARNCNITNHHNVRGRLYESNDVRRARLSRQMRMAHSSYMHHEWEEIPETVLGENENFGKSKRKKHQPDETGRESSLKTAPTENKGQEEESRGAEKGNRKRKSAVRKLLDLTANSEAGALKKEDTGDMRELLWRPRRASSRRTSEAKIDPLGALADVESGNDGGGKPKIKLKERESISLKSELGIRDLERDKQSEATIVPRSTKKEKDKKVNDSHLKQEEEIQSVKLDTGNLDKKLEHTSRKHKSTEKRKELRMTRKPSAEEDLVNAEQNPVDQYQEDWKNKEVHQRRHLGRRRSRSRGSRADSPHIEREYERRTSEKEQHRHVEGGNSLASSTPSKRHHGDLSRESSTHDRRQIRKNERVGHTTKADGNDDTSLDDRCSDYCSCGSTRSSRSRDKCYRRHGRSSSDVNTRSRRLCDREMRNHDRHRRRQKARSMPSRLCGKYGSDDIDECTCDSGSVRHISVCSRDSQRYSCSCDCESLRCRHQFREPRRSRANEELLDALSEVCSELESRLYDELPRGGKTQAFRGVPRTNLASYLSPDTLTLLENEHYAPRSRGYNYDRDCGYNPRLPPRPPRRHAADGEIENAMCHCSPAKQPNVAPTPAPTNNQSPVFYPVPQPVPVPTVTVQSAPPNQVWYSTPAPAANVFVRPSPPSLINAQHITPAPTAGTPFMIPNVTTPLVQSSMLFPSFAYCQRL